MVYTGAREVELRDEMLFDLVLLVRAGCLGGGGQRDCTGNPVAPEATGPLPAAWGGPFFVTL